MFRAAGAIPLHRSIGQAPGVRLFVNVTTAGPLFFFCFIGPFPWGSFGSSSSSDLSLCRLLLFSPSPSGIVILEDLLVLLGVMVLVVDEFDL